MKYQLYDSDQRQIKVNSVVSENGLGSYLYLKVLLKDIQLTVHFNSDITITTTSSSKIKQVKKSVLQVNVPTCV